MHASNVVDTLKDRGFIQQTTDEAALRQLLDKPATCYIGFDGTASSLHIGHLIPVMTLSHMQRAGHRIIALVGGGTSMIGDPSGKTELRKMLSAEDIDENVRKIGVQLGKYLDFGPDQGLLLNNGKWLRELNYIEFLRDIGRHFSVNRMLAAEAYKQRLERGLSFIEFNYQLLQSYDYLVLHREQGCRLQMGGDDQWGNILAGVDLIRRVEGQEVHAMTYKLLTTADGKKMGKTEAGAVWLDGELLKPFEYFQFWMNVDDRDVERLLGIFTFLDMNEVRELGKLQGAEIREAKRKLAYEATVITHGKQAADLADQGARSAFGGAGGESLPTTELNAEDFSKPVLDLFVLAGLAGSKSEARRLIAQGGAQVNERKIVDERDALQADELAAGQIVLRAGKKKVHRLVRLP